MDASLPVALLEGLCKMKDTRKAISQGQALHPSTKFASFRAQGLADFDPQVPLLVTVEECPLIVF